MAAMAQYKGNRNLSQAGKKLEGREVPRRLGNAGGGKAPDYQKALSVLKREGEVIAVRLQTPNKIRDL